MLTYNGERIIPAPFASISREAIARDDGILLGHTYSITLKGKLVAYKGSPNSSGTFWNQSGYPPDETSLITETDSRLGAILRKQGALRALFSVEGQSLEIQSADGSAPMKCNPRVKSIQFSEGNWFDVCDYQITLEADTIIGIGDPAEPNGFVTKVNEDWNIEILDEKFFTYRLTHALSATGKVVYDENGDLLNGKQAWENAQDYVLNNDINDAGFGLGIATARMQAPGVLDDNSLQAFNYIRSNSINETSGVFSVTETWVCYDPGAGPPSLNDFTVNLRYSSQDNKTTASIEGTISGFEVRDNQTRALISTRWTNALSMWTSVVSPNLFSVAQTSTGVTINPVSLSNQLGMNPTTGVITYHWEYDNRPLPAVAGAITEHVTVNDNHAANVFAQIPVLGRALGPVLQDIGTVTSKKRSIQIEVQMPPSTMTFTAAEPNTTALVTSLIPPGTSFLENDEESWNPNSGRYTRSTTFVWE